MTKLKFPFGSEMLRVAFALAALLAASPSAVLASTFVDSFNRPDGPVGNGWSDTSANGSPYLVISSGVLTTQGHGGEEAMIYRPIDESGSISASATATQESGYYGGLLGRYTTKFDFFNNGTINSGYSVSFGRGDNNYQDANVILFYDGIMINRLSSTFHYGPSIDISATIGSDNEITGTVSENENVYHFDLGMIPFRPSGQNFGIDLIEPNSTTFPETAPTVSNLVLTTVDPVPEPGPWTLMLAGVAMLVLSARANRRSFKRSEVIPGTGDPFPASC